MRLVLLLIRPFAIFFVTTTLAISALASEAALKACVAEMERDFEEIFNLHVLTPSPPRVRIARSDIQLPRDFKADDLANALKKQKEIYDPLTKRTYLIEAEVKSPGVVNVTFIDKETGIRVLSDERHVREGTYTFGMVRRLSEDPRFQSVSRPLFNFYNDVVPSGAQFEIHVANKETINFLERVGKEGYEMGLSGDSINRFILERFRESKLGRIFIPSGWEVVGYDFHLGAPRFILRKP